MKRIRTIVGLVSVPIYFGIFVYLLLWPSNGRISFGVALVFLGGGSIFTLILFLVVLLFLSSICGLLTYALLCFLARLNDPTI
jgi:hypothetical protein